MFSFILFTFGWTKKKEFDISFLSFNSNSGYRSLFRLVYQPKKRILAQVLWNWNYERKTIYSNEV